MEFEDILNNSFTLKLSDLVVQIQKVAIDNKNIKLGENNFHFLSDIDKNIMNMFDIQSKLVYNNEQLIFVNVFIKRFSDKSYLISNGINQLRYIQYHYEVFAHKIHTILELMKLMINEVFNLGIHPKDCSWENIRKRKELKSYKGINILNAFYVKFKNIINLRHANTHRGIFIDSEMDELSGPLFLYEASEKFDLDMDEYRKVYPKHLLDYQIKKYRKSKVEIINSLGAESFKLTKAFLTSLEEELNRKITAHNKTFTSGGFYSKSKPATS
ncbi:hypothetical protein I2I11_15885 [Pontibacter sp. 172403-2]|uniref:Cthe_2314 family HEPN domain-containing protein n=1 Tax=Pontibacter rufus TaxID=2791028 RepID=UPI0018AF6F09|nr:Cthe_2314 family HEPN domain-containing protein [Pontibacter sp. 172403-2]MBF9254785.1 hypothetical protein [Pontibacter sp. 172403-2]